MKNEYIRLVGGIENVLPLHPLINPSSAHYDTEEETAIEQMERAMTVIEMIGACKYNIMKYEYRKKHKGQLESDEVKLKNCRDYLKLLNSFIFKHSDIAVEEAFVLYGLKWRYR